MSCVWPQATTKSIFIPLPLYSWVLFLRSWCKCYIIMIGTIYGYNFPMVFGSCIITLIIEFGRSTSNSDKNTYALLTLNIARKLWWACSLCFPHKEITYSVFWSTLITWKSTKSIYGKIQVRNIQLMIALLQLICSHLFYLYLSTAWLNSQLRLVRRCWIKRYTVYCIGEHGGFVVSMFASHLRGWDFNSHLSPVCARSLHVFPVLRGSPVSFPSPKTCVVRWLASLHCP